MPHHDKFLMTPFQRGLYRHYINARRQFNKKHGANIVMTRIRLDKDDPAKSTEQVVEIDRTWPLNLAGITRILRLHTLKNQGEGRTQALRLIAEIDDQGEKGVLSATIDLLYGIVEFRFRYTSWGGTEISGPAIRIGDLLRPDEQPAVLALYRLCELLDADDTLGLRGFHRAFIAEALAHPEGLGFPKFTKEACRDLLSCVRGANAAVRSGIPEGLKDGLWYAMQCTPFHDDPPDTLRLFIGQAYTLGRSVDDWNFREGGISIVAENDGYGRVVPMYEPRLFRPWLPAGTGKLFPWYEARLEAIKPYVVRPFRDTSKMMAECLKTV